MDAPTLAQAAADWAKAPTVTTEMSLCAAAVIDYLGTLPSVPRDTDNNLTPSSQLGAIMLTARLERRRNSTSGIESSTDLGIAYVARTDSDISRLLRLDQHSTIQIG